MATITLDPEQRRAAMATERFVRVLAGAGTGKTTTLVARVRYLIQHERLDPRQLCVLTFSKKAAEELGRRIGESGTGAFIGTIHALGYRMLQFERANRPVADERKRRGLILRAMKELSVKEPLALVASRIARARAFGQPYPRDVEEIGMRYEALLHGEPEPHWDFDDLLLEPVTRLGADQEMRGRWAARFKHVLVDEAQDTSYVQWALIRYLVGLLTAVYLVGDAYQAIYTWRGADADGMLGGAEERFGASFTTYTVGMNYRSRPAIIAVANRVLQGKPDAVPLVGSHDPGAAVEVEAVLGTTVAEAVAEAVAVVCPRWQPGEVAILGRTRAALGQAEAACIQHELPYVLLGATSFYERAEVRDILAYLEYASAHAMNRPEGLGEALDRMYNKPSRYLGKVWVDALHSQGGWTRWETEGPQGFRWPQRYMGQRAAELWAICQVLRRMESTYQATTVIDYVLQDVGYRSWVRGEGLAEAEATEDNDVEDNLDALRQLAEGKTLKQFMDFVDLCRHTPRRTQAGACVLSTIHRAKGLEWPCVIVAGVEHGILPHHRGEPEGEERRLYYVAVSRAAEHLVLAGSGNVSRYLAESASLVWPPPEEDAHGEAQSAAAALDEGGGAAGNHGRGDGAGGAGEPAAVGMDAPDRDDGLGGPADGLGQAGGADRGDLPGGAVVLAPTRRRRPAAAKERRR